MKQGAKKEKKSIWKSRIKDRGEEFKEKLGGDKASKEGRERERERYLWINGLGCSSH